MNRPNDLLIKINTTRVTNAYDPEVMLNLNRKASGGTRFTNAFTTGQ